MKIVISITALLFSFSVHAKAPAKAAVCAACHGANGISTIKTYPNLKGLKKGYIVAQLKAFRDGKRKNAIMGPQAKGLSDKEITELADYYAKMK